MKKILVIIFLIILIPCRIHATDTLRCFGDLNSNDEKILEPGDIVTLNMGVSGYSDVQYISDAVFSFTYNPSIFELVVDEGSYLQVFNKWIIYKNTSTKVNETTQRVDFSIGTTVKNNYFYDTSDSLIFAKVKLKVKSNAEDGSASIVAFNGESYYTTFEMDEQNIPTDVYDVSCYSRNIYLTIKAPVKDSNALLKSLRVTNQELNPKFNPEVNDYSIDVEYVVEQVYIAGTCAGVKCTVTGNGTRTLKEGENNYDIVVTAEDGSTNTYTVTINRAEKGKELAYLISLKVEGHSLDPNFKSNNLVYTISLSKDVSTIKIYGICQSKKCLINGDGIINVSKDTKAVLVIVETEDDTKTYTINIKREDSLDNYDPNETGNGSFTTFLWVIFIIMIGGALFYLYKKSGINIKIIKNKKDDKDKIDNSWRFK